MKTQQVHIRLEGDELSFLDKAADGLVSRQMAATILLKRAIRVARDSGKSPIFSEALSGDALRETAAPYGKRQPTK